ncbi:mitochondrial peptide methionine sulfoxide reductase isoform X2 [Tiliqua scincoides]|uniref:mitochondrial peptide methionine sulfoxide reductase isoform X2 n=1 Tax=Tiliqua scincoides TaxID=71010 RepID=UPI003462E55E
MTLAASRRLFCTLAGMGEAASSSLRPPSKEATLPGRNRSLVRIPDKHHVNGNCMAEPFPEGTHMTIFGRTGHAEVVRVVFQPETISFEKLLKVFWENHDPTQGMRQGNDVGTQYRSAIYTLSPEQMEASLRSKEDYQKVLTENGFGAITTEIREAPEFYYAEEYHQQYLSKHPNGYCGLGGTGVSCPLGLKEQS